MALHAEYYELIWPGRRPTSSVAGAIPIPGVRESAPIPGVRESAGLTLDEFRDEPGQFSPAALPRRPVQLVRKHEQTTH